MSHRKRRHDFRWALAATAVLCLAPAASCAHAQDSRYGDSTWVAPYPVADSLGDPTALGPRVTDPPGEPLGETILRAPFRLIGLPFRALGAGFQELAGAVGPRIFAPHERVGVHLPAAVISPTIDYTTTTGLEPGFSVHRNPWRTDVPDITIHGSWSFKDQRRASFRYRVGGDTLRWGGALFADYRFTPTTRFYGMGNTTHKEGRSFYLAERGEINASAGKVLAPRTLFQLVAGFSSFGSRRTYNASPHLEDVYDTAEVTGFGHATVAFSYGATGEWSRTSASVDPTSGVYLRGQVQRVHSTDGSGLRYVQLDGEVRGYIPVFAPRRVIALRGAYEVANPDAGSLPIPFDRLPASVHDYRFLAFHGSQFRDQQVAVGQVEYRWILTGEVRIFALAQLGEVAPSTKLMRIDDVHESYGGGLRYVGPTGGTIRFQLETGAQGINVDLVISRGF